MGESTLEFIRCKLIDNIGGEYDWLERKTVELFENWKRTLFSRGTLSDNGGVTRGICKMDEENNLTEVVETKNIVKTADGAEADGKVIDVNSLVSIEYVRINSWFSGCSGGRLQRVFREGSPGQSFESGILDFNLHRWIAGAGYHNFKTFFIATSGSFMISWLTSLYKERKNR